LSKAEVRQLARERNLPTADLPSMACLASRIPYGDQITAAKLRQVADAEQLLRDIGISQVRVRHHGDIARLEVMPQDMDKLVREPTRSALVDGLLALGFRYCTLDLIGYRSGSLNEMLSGEETASE